MMGSMMVRRFFSLFEWKVDYMLDKALVWFREHFIKCNDRVALVKTWLPDQYTGPRTWVDELVYNRALTLVRSIPPYLSMVADLRGSYRVVMLRGKNFLISM